MEYVRPLTVSEFLDRLQNVGTTKANQYFASCPNASAHKHGDKAQSFHVSCDHATGRILFDCKVCGGGAKEEILRAIGLTYAHCRGNGQKGASRSTPRAASRSVPTPKPGMPADEIKTILDRSRGNPKKVAELSTGIGVSNQSLQRLRFGYDPNPPTGSRPDQGAYTIPESRGDGTDCGVSIRALDGSKFFVKGGSRGLTCASDWRLRPDGTEFPQDETIFIEEGATSTAAGMTMGLCIFGRPSNSTGAKDIAEKVAPYAYQGAKIVIVGQNDQNADAWPGRTGPIQTAKQVADILKLPIFISMTPRGKLSKLPKDLRDICKQIVGRSDLLEQGQKLKAELESGAEMFGDEYAIRGTTIPINLIDIPKCKCCGSTEHEQCQDDAPKCPSFLLAPDDKEVYTENSDIWAESAAKVRGTIDDDPAFVDGHGCRFGTQKLFKGINQNRRKGALMWVACDNWECEACSTRNRRDWFDQLARHICQDRDSIFFTEVRHEDLAALLKKIKRHGGEYMAFKLSNCVRILSNVQLKNFTHTDNPYRMMQTGLRRIDVSAGKPVITSRGWCKAQPKEKIPQWESWGNASTMFSFGKVALAIGRSAVRNLEREKVKKRNIHASLIFDFAPELTDAQIEICFRWWSLGKTPPANWEPPSLWNDYADALGAMPTRMA